MDTFGLDDDYLLGVNYVKSVITETDVAGTIEATVDADTLIRSLLLTSTLLALELKTRYPDDLSFEEFFQKVAKRSF